MIQLANLCSLRVHTVVHDFTSLSFLPSFLSHLRHPLSFLSQFKTPLFPPQPPLPSLSLPSPSFLFFPKLRLSTLHPSPPPPSHCLPLSFPGREVTTVIKLKFIASLSLSLSLCSPFTPFFFCCLCLSSLLVAFLPSSPFFFDLSSLPNSFLIFSHF